MNIYCAGAIRGDTGNQLSVKQMIEYVSELGHNALSEFNDDYTSCKKLSDEEIFERDLNWLNNSDAVIAEVSGPSLGVGFEISFALYEKKIQVLALCDINKPNTSAMIKGNNSNLLDFNYYSDEVSLKNIIKKFIQKISKD